jgi:hypothetical protein
MFMSSFFTLSNFSSLRTAFQNWSWRSKRGCATQLRWSGTNTVVEVGLTFCGLKHRAPPPPCRPLLIPCFMNFMNSVCWHNQTSGNEACGKFNVFHVRALYYTKNINHQQMHKEFFSSIVTHSYMFRPCWVIFREKLSVVVTLVCTLQLSDTIQLTAAHSRSTV